jgi:aspartate kinase
MEKAVVAGIAFDRNEARINVKGVPDKPGIAYQILGPISDANIEVDMIIQNVGDNGTTDFSFTVPRGEYQKALSILRDLQGHLGAADINGDDKIAKVSIVGVGMRSHCGIASTMFRTLAEEGINIQLISTSEIKVSVLIDEKYLELAVRAGVIRGMEFEMSGYITHLQKNYPELLVFLTGGDEFSFDTKLKSIIFADRFLVLKGLNRILSYNDKL